MITTYHLGRSTIQGTQDDIDRRLAAMGLAVKGGRDE